MPELPEVECVRLGIESVKGAQICQVEWNYPALWDKATVDPHAIECQKLVETHRKGKYLILEFENHLLLLHLGMSGVFLLQESQVEPRPHTHLILKLKGKGHGGDSASLDGWELRFSDPRKFGHLHLIKKGGVSPQYSVGDEFERWSKLGPDALTRSFHGKYFHAKCQKSIRDIKIFILDQKVVAGVGNIYASEALFRAKIDPRRPANSLSMEECTNLAKAAKWIMKKSVKKRGTTFSDYRLTNGKGGSFQSFLKVFQKENETCPGCKSNQILKLEQDKRSTFYCSSCQN